MIIQFIYEMKLIKITLVPCSIAFYWVLVVMHYGFYQLRDHYEVNQQDLNMVHHYGIMNHAMRHYSVCCDNIRPLGYMSIVWHFLGHLSNQLDPSMNHVQYHLNLNGFEYVTQLMSFQHIVPMIRRPLAVTSLVVVAAFWHVHALLLYEPWLFPEFKKENKSNHLEKPKSK